MEEKDSLTSKFQPCSDSPAEEPTEINLRRMLAFVNSLIISLYTYTWGYLLQ